MPELYPSWIEIPATNLDRALPFYRAVFGLTDTPLYDDELPVRIAVLLPSEKNVRHPGVSIVQSPNHIPGPTGPQINFHLGEHAALSAALKTIVEHGGSVLGQIVDMGDGVRFITVLDCEGNTIALSSYEPFEEGEDGENQ